MRYEVLLTVRKVSVVDYIRNQSQVLKLDGCRGKEDRNRKRPGKSGRFLSSSDTRSQLKIKTGGDNVKEGWAKVKGE